jgi:hypothetical protein
MYFLNPMTCVSLCLLFFFSGFIAMFQTSLCQVARFFLEQHTKKGKLYLMTGKFVYKIDTNYTK